MWPFKSKVEKEQIEQARSAFDAFGGSIKTAAPEQAVSLAEEFGERRAAQVLSEREWSRRADDAFRDYAEAVLADDHMTAEEEDAFGVVAGALGVSTERLQTEYPELLGRLAVARVNNGRLRPVSEPQLMAKSGEVVYLEISAALLKEVAIREWQGGGGGLSFRVAKGVRYHTGRTRGRSVVVGTEIQIADVGVLSVSSRRIAFMGEKKTMEFPLTKLMDLDMFENGVRIHSSNRQNAPLFELQAHTADVFAATVNAVVQAEEPPA